MGGEILEGIIGKILNIIGSSLAAWKLSGTDNKQQKVLLFPSKSFVCSVVPILKMVRYIGTEMNTVTNYW